MQIKLVLSLAAAALLGLGLTTFGADGKSGGGKEDAGKPKEGRKSFDLSFIPEDCSAVVIFHPRRIFHSPLAKQLSAEDIEVLLREMNKSRGTDVRKIEQEVMLQVPPTSEFDKHRSVTQTGRIVRFTEPTVTKESVLKLFSEWVFWDEPAQYEGKQYYRAYYKRKGPPPEKPEDPEDAADYAQRLERWFDLAVHIPGERTLVAATSLAGSEALLKKMLSAHDDKGSGVQRLRQIDVENDFVLLVQSIESFPRLTNSRSGEMPVGTKWFENIRSTGRVVTLTANLRGVPVAKLLVEAKDADSAEKLHKVASEDIEAARKAYGIACKEKGQVGMELLAAIFNDLSVAQEGDRVTVTLNKPEALGKLPAFLTSVAEGMRQQQSRMERRVRNPGQVGMVVVYEVAPDETPRGAKKPEVDMRKLVDALDRRLNPSGRPAGRIRQLDDRRVEVSIFQADRDVMQRIANLLPRPGTLEFRILANAHDHRPLIERAEAKPDSKRLLADDGSVTGWWVPVAEVAKKEFDTSKDRAFDASEKLATRTVIAGGRQVLEVLVVKDSFDVNGSFLSQVAVDTDLSGRPCVALTFATEGARRFGGLTESNLPERGGARTRKLGIIVDGVLHSAPVIRSKVSERGQITGRFTPEESQDLADLLSAGALPVAIRQVEKRILEVEKQPSP